MTQEQQVINALQKNGGYATLRQLYELVDVSKWGGKTPRNTMRCMMQRSNAFFKIQPGLWALSDEKDTVLQKLHIETEETKHDEQKKEEKEEIFTHSYFQGMLVEIGNMKKLDTYIPPPDKNKLFLETPIGQLTTTSKVYPFTYSNILHRAETVDVIWFNERKLPNSFFEVEHSTNIQNSLDKFFELQDFFARFYIVAPETKHKQFDTVIERSIFLPIKKRVSFMNYDAIAAQYSAMVNAQQSMVI